MSRARAFLLSGCLLAIAVAAGGLLWSAPGAGAETRKVTPKWEYGTLEYEEPYAEVGSRVIWTAGQKLLGGKSEKFQIECISKLNKALGGKEKTAGIGVLLNRIGQGGWELVAHTRSAGQRSVTQTWTFKRLAP